MSRLHFLKSVTDTINTSFILECGSTLLVVDGGFPTEAPYMYEYLKGLGGHVSMWLLTHIHDDHVSCLYEILNNHPDIKIDSICYNFPSDDFILRYEPDQGKISSEELLSVLRKAISASSARLITAQKGDVYTFEGGRVTVRVLRVPDESITCNPINNSSAIFRFEADGKSILFLGDLGAEGGDQLVEHTPAELLRADYLQMAHHGQNGVNRECYAAIRPSYCLWATPSWLWNNHGPGGYDTG
ncbi:MAG: MBL fold metallo-hydrolase, partial [Clostridia bacterium]|nr:MBL fold metallo-hydrolase [Clostridia bacterium]